jgi:predicted GH43/DUF377 family glycosyl hydrolase
MVKRIVAALIAALWISVALVPATANSPRTWTHTTQADFMAAERQNVDVRILDALGTPYDYDADPQGGVRLQSQAGPWTKYAENPVLDIGAPGAWDDEIVDEAKVVFDGQTYHMWYLGRKASGDPEGKLPVMVGYATSDDALHWTKAPENPVLRFGPTGSYDSLGIHAPFVLFDGQIFRMWYSAWRADSQGSSVWSINYASSTDGTAWTKDPDNPLMVEERNERWDATYICEPSVLWNGDRFEMWYNGGSERTAAGGHELRVGYASSVNGLEWRRRSEDAWVLDVGDPEAWDDFSVARPHVIYDGLRYRMWYEGHDGVNFRIGQASSRDGLHWTKEGDNPSLDLGSPGSWDSLHVHEPYVLFDSELYRMWYSGYDGQHVRIGLATAPPVYVRQGVLASAPIDGNYSTTWRSLSWQVDLPDGADMSIAVATSDDGRTWSRWHTVASHSQDGDNMASLAGVPGLSDGQAGGDEWPVARYFRYRATLTTTDPGRSPVLQEITVSEEALPTPTPLATSTLEPASGLSPMPSPPTVTPLPPGSGLASSPPTEVPGGTATLVPVTVEVLQPTITLVPIGTVTNTGDQQINPHALYVLGALAITGVAVALGTAWRRSHGPPGGIGG